MMLISRALKEYLKDYNGNFPPSLWTLYPKYVKDPFIFHCPLDCCPERIISYLYTPPDRTDPDTTVILSCERHYSYGERRIGMDKWRWGVNIIMMKNLEIRIIGKKKLSSKEIDKIIEEVRDRTRSLIKE